MLKSRLKKAFGIIAFYSGFYYIYSFAKNFLGRREVAILMYHRVNDIDDTSVFDESFVSTSRANFEKQMKFLSNKCNVITFDDLIVCCKSKQKIPDKCVIITFDDGYKDNYANAFPILKKYDLSAAISLTTGHIESKELLWWDKIAYVIEHTKLKEFDISGLGKHHLTNIDQRKKTIKLVQENFKKLSDEEKNNGIAILSKELEVRIPKFESLFLSWSEIKKMGRNKITFVPHTVSHKILTRIGFKDARKEILVSKKKIEKEIEAKTRIFAYPNGQPDDMSEEIDEFLKRKGFIFSLSAIYGVNKIDKPLFRLKRIGISYDDDLRIFRLKLLGFGSLMSSIYSRLLK